MESIFSEVDYSKKEDIAGFNRCTGNIERICANTRFVTQGGGGHIQL